MNPVQEDERRWTKGLGTPDDPAIRFTRGTDFGATPVRDCYGLPGLGRSTAQLCEC
jgi:hypothetical protein